MREVMKTVEIDGRRFLIKKLPAATAYALLAEILTKGLPLNIIGTVLEQFIPAGMLKAAGKRTMTVEEMEKLELAFLSCVSEMLLSGPVETLDSQGNFQVENLEYDMLLFGELLAEVLKWQYADFFTGILRKLGIEDLTIQLDDPEKLKTLLSNIS
jgi:hypothetical protein